MNRMRFRKVRVSLLILLLSGMSFKGDSADFIFTVSVDKQTCKLSVQASSGSEVDFGTLQANTIKNKTVAPIPITLTLSSCFTTNFTDTYVSMKAKNALTDITFNDNADKNFGIRVSSQNNVTNSNAAADFIKNNGRVWDDIKGNALTKRLYVYVRCTDATCEPQTGSFISTLTFTYIVD